MAIYQPSLLDQTPDQPDARRLSPSEEYDLAHPGAYNSSIKKPSGWDPNARRASQLQGIGGGLAAALTGELVFETAEESFSADKRVQNVAQVICGDCAQVIPCAHANGHQTIGY